ncbi:myosin-6-like [Hordeum vulgare]|nr:myosin-6-like [Hordeum vulgare]
MDAIYCYDEATNARAHQEKPSATDPHHFRRARISALALLKMVVHASAGGTIEIMGLMQGRIWVAAAYLETNNRRKKTNIFDWLIHIFSSTMQKQDSNADLAYWLSNASSLLSVLQKSLKPAGSGVTTPLKRMTTQTSFLGRMVFRASSITVDMDLVRQVEGKYPALLFKQQLTAFVEGLYGMIRDNVKREVSHMLFRSQQFFRKIFTQIFAFINAQLFNSLLVGREWCSFSNGEYVKQGLEELEAWCTQSKPETNNFILRSAWDELKHISQAVGFLWSISIDFELHTGRSDHLCAVMQVIFKKFRVSYDEIMSDLCPVIPPPPKPNAA